ncbi:hypothetical protein PIB30_081646 [Stylosanthes scabra]|uniref:Uncharacterized protein n=1 Tax=Stylosanthes scabra TaxID=79078 RepID=A0ABU6VQJ5_9FABA|nr:hypothetical protein [Stylosanthes scabra]
MTKKEILNRSWGAHQATPLPPQQRNQVGHQPERIRTWIPSPGPTKTLRLQLRVVSFVHQHRRRALSSVHPAALSSLHRVLHQSSIVPSLSSPLIAQSSSRRILYRPSIILASSSPFRAVNTRVLDHSSA